MHRRAAPSLSSFLILCSAVAMAPRAATAQEAPTPKASQHGVVAQDVNATRLTLEYDRPVARGRDLFGGILDWDAVWTPGANRATWIDASTDVVFEGVPVAAGRYGIWMIPHEGRPWEVILVRDWDTHHSFYPFEGEVARVEVTPVQGAHMETLAFYFPVVGPYDTELRMHWGTTVVPLRIQVPS